MSLCHRAALATILIVLTLQLIVPTIQWFADGPNRWGWQMYSRLPDDPTVIALYPDGEYEALELSDHLYRQRYELLYDDALAERLCERLPDATGIVIKSDRRGEETGYQCER